MPPDASAGPIAKLFENIQLKNDVSDESKRIAPPNARKKELLTLFCINEQLKNLPFEFENDIAPPYANSFSANVFPSVLAFILNYFQCICK